MSKMNLKKTVAIQAFDCLFPASGCCRLICELVRAVTHPSRTLSRTRDATGVNP